MSKSSGPPGGGWRHTGGSARPGQPSRPGIPASTGRGRKAFFAAFFLLAVAGTVVALILFMRPPPPPLFISIAVTQYDDRSWPTNPWADADSGALRALFPEGEGAQAFQSQQKELILRELNQLPDRSRSDAKGRPILVHLSALVTEAEGGVQILPAQARPGDPSTWIPLSAILEPLRKAQGNRLLILDLHPVTDARLGCVGIDAGPALHAELDRLEKAGELPFWVLCSSGSDQIPLATPDLKQTAFGFFLAKGLAGHADVWNPEGTKDRRISVRELAAYTRSRTTAFTEIYRTPQSPELYGKANDFHVINCPEDAGGVALPDVLEAPPEWLTAAWKLRDDLRDSGTANRLPRTVLQLESFNLAAERLWLGGGASATTQQVSKDTTTGVTQQRDAWPIPEPPERSIALARKRGIKLEKEVARAMQPLLEKIRTPGAKPDEVLGLQQPVWAKPPEMQPATAVVAAIVETFTDPDKPLNLEQARYLSSTIKGLRPVPRHAESLYLHFVADLDPRVTRRWEAGSVPGVLRSSVAAERVTTVDSRALPWIRKSMSKTDDETFDAMVLLLGEDADLREKARKTLLQCEQDYGAIRLAAESLEKAFAQLDETRAILLPLATELPPGNAAQEPTDAHWTRVIGEMKALQTALTPPKDGALPRVELLDQHTRDIRVYREKLLSSYSIPSTASPREVREWLNWSGWNQRKRLDIIDRSNTEGRALAQEALDKSGKQSPKVDLNRRAMAANPIDEPMRRARRSIDLLTLVGDPKAAALEESLEKVRKGNDPKERRALFDAIRLQWSAELPQRYRTEGDVFKREAMAWIIHPFDLPGISRKEERPFGDAAAEARRDQDRIFQQWLAAERYTRIAQKLRNLDPPTPAVTTFALALEELARELSSWAVIR